MQNLQDNFRTNDDLNLGLNQMSGEPTIHALNEKIFQQPSSHLTKKDNNSILDLYFLLLLYVYFAHIYCKTR